MNVAIIAAAGQGVRMGTKRAKQFLELDGIPVIIHTLTRFEECPDIDEVVVVLPEKDVKRFPALARKYGLAKVVNCIAGGTSRTHSVRLGLGSIRAADVKIVAVHDGVRPFVTPGEISQTIRVAKRTGAAILATPVTDTIKLVDRKFVMSTPPRSQMQRALTPQCFDFQLLRRALASTKSDTATDESMLVERLTESERFGFRKRRLVAVVAGDPRNIKITQPEDIALAEIILKQNPEFRIKKVK